MLKVLENNATNIFPLECGMKTLLSGILITGVTKGSERLDERVFSDELYKSLGTVLGTFIRMDDDSFRKRPCQ